jgi:HK97 family phage portal protein
VAKKKHRRAEVETRSSYSIGDPALAEYLGLSGVSLAGVSVTEQSALGLTAVYRAVALISGTIGGLPLKSYRTTADGIRERVATFLDNPGGPDGPTAYEWVELVLVHLLLHGNAYLRHLYNGGGAVIGLQILHPSAVTIRRVDAPWRVEYDILLSDGTKETLSSLDLTHIPALGTDGVKGIAPITACRQAIGTGLAGDQAAARMFGSSLLLGGIVSVAGITKEQAEEVKAGLQAKLTGVHHAGDIAVVNKDLTFSPWSMSPEDAQFIETRIHQVEEVARIFGVPPHLLGQTEKQTSWGTGVSEQNRGLARYTLAPWTTRIEQRLSRLLTRPTTCEFDYAGLLQPAPDEEIRLLLEEVKGGLLTVDEARRIRNLPPLPAAAPAPAPAEEEVPA